MERATTLQGVNEPLYKVSKRASKERERSSPSVSILNQIGGTWGTSLIRNSAPLGPYSKTMPRALWCSQGGGRFLMSEVPLYRAGGRQGGARRVLSRLVPWRAGSTLHHTPRPVQTQCFFFFFFTLVTGPRRSLSLTLSETRVYEPQIRARLGTTAYLCRVEYPTQGARYLGSSWTAAAGCEKASPGESFRCTHESRAECLSASAAAPEVYRGTSLIRNVAPQGPYRRTMPRAVWKP